ncbi:FliM/FliN family flagellar motor switch protein [Ahrensia sp. R2A130]|uniref:FliM/FliN family flagellar motor switch protein n=1 Tax=Ahrensia sp. R2A130 TaxID=744979 RepID=UPI0001E083CD|nr:FliM/FliN family flagellar motor switch protein [Ahrensia sp. R2A130]EFL89504.1 flagellar motor switch protein FliN [Ahrensia sp. R2A130]
MTSELDGPAEEVTQTTSPEIEGAPATPRYDFDKVADALADVSPAASRSPVSPKRDATNSLWSIPLDVDVVLGHARLPVSDLMNLSIGDTLSLDRRIGDPVEIVANGTTIAWGQLCAVDESGERFGVRLTKLSGAAKAAPSARKASAAETSTNKNTAENEAPASDVSDQRVA